MAIIGGTGTENDPVVITTLDDLKSLLEVDTPPIISMDDKRYFIEFPAMYAGPKVLDYRSRGWNPIRFTFNWDAYDSQSIYINFNGWEILGLSTLDAPYMTFGTRAGRVYVYFRNMTMKNMYVLGNSEAISYFDASGSVTLFFQNCKFSGVIDAQNNKVTFFKNSYSGNCRIETCSFNMNMTNRVNNSGKRCIFMEDSYHTGRSSNCLFKFDSTRFNMNSADSFFTCGSVMFCKFTGDMNTYGSYAPVFIFGSNSVYNVIDIHIKAYTTVTISSNSSGGVELFNTSKVELNNPLADTINWNDSGFTHVNNQQLTDSTYLNSIFFICGDPPS